MSFIKKIISLTESLGSSRNLSKFTHFQVKDNNFLGAIDSIYVIKKAIQYVNEELEEFNKKIRDKNKDNKDYVSYQKSLLGVKIAIKNSGTKKINLNFLKKILDPKANINLIKQEFIEEIFNSYKENKIISINKINLDKTEFHRSINMEIFNYLQSNVKLFIFTLKNKKTRIGGRYFKQIDFTRLNFGFEMHDIFAHNLMAQRDFLKFVNPKGVKYTNKFKAYGFETPYIYSPESILQEIYALQTDYMVDPVFLSSKFEEDFFRDFKEILSDNKLLDRLNRVDANNEKVINFIKNFFEPLEKKYKSIVDRLKIIILSRELSKKVFTREEIRIILNFLKSSENKDYFYRTIDNIEFRGIDKIVDYKYIKDLNFFEKVSNSIAYRLRKKTNKSIDTKKSLISSSFDEEEAKPATWKDFRQFFKNYPFLLNIFKNEDDNEKIDNNSIRNEKKLVNAIKTTDNLLRKVVAKKDEKTTKSNNLDIPDFQEKIDFLFERILTFINNLSDNSKFYTILNRKIKEHIEKQPK